MRQYVVDAFTDEVFRGNQAAVCVMEGWPDERLMKAIARENNFSETAFTVREGDAWRLRWFTPTIEIDLCGHATLATAYALFRFHAPEADEIAFRTMSGELRVARRDGWLVMDFPAYRLEPVPVTAEMEAALGARPLEAYLDRDLLLVYDDEATVREMRPDIALVAGLPGMAACPTAPGAEFDCVSRFFAPDMGIEEDPVTGSAHCMVAPYWAQRLSKDEIHAWQASERGGELLCEVRGGRVSVAGKAALYSVCELRV
jgi:predicted PhzF superfamily epimerase YddE/YHI9